MERRQRCACARRRGVWAGWTRCGSNWVFGLQSIRLLDLGEGHGSGRGAPSRDEIEVAHARGRDDAAPLAVELHDPGLLQLLANVPDEAARNLREMLRPRALPVRRAVDLAELANTDALLQVDLAPQRVVNKEAQDLLQTRRNIFCVYAACVIEDPSILQVLRNFGRLVFGCIDADFESK